MGKRVVFALYCDDGKVTKAFERLEEAFFTNYGHEIIYGVIIDPTPSAVFKSITDSILAEQARREVERLSRIYGECFFAMLRERKYNAVALRNGEYRYACEEGLIGASGSFFRCFKGDFSAFSYIFGERNMKGECFILDHCVWDSPSIALRCDFLKNGLKEISCKRKASVKNVICTWISRNGDIYALPAEEFLAYKENLTSHLPSKEELFFLKSAAGSASKYFFDIYDRRVSLPETVNELVLTVCAVVSMRIFNCIGEAEALELTDRLIRKIKRVVALIGDSGINGDVLLLLCAGAEGLCEVMTEPEFILLRSELLEIKSLLAKMHRVRFGGELSGAICCKELEMGGGKTGETARRVLFSLTLGEFSGFIAGRLGKGGAEFNAQVLIYAAQLAFGAPFRRFLHKNKEFNSRCGLLSIPKPVLDIKEEQVKKEDFFCSAQAAGELLERFDAFRGVKYRLISAGISKSELPYIAYLENCVKKQSFLKQKSVCFACDEVSELIISLARAARAVPFLDFTLVTSDTYGVKRLSDVSKNVKVLSCDKIKTAAKESGFFRKITPYSTLNELICELE